MTQLIDPSDPRYFTKTSESLYDRHHYKVVSKEGDTIVIDNWQDALIIWWNKKDFLSHMEILDTPKGGKGFA